MNSTIKYSFLFATLAFVSAHAWSGANEVPFKATVTIVNDTLRPSDLSKPPCPTSPFVGLTIGSGNASQLGSIAFVGNDCVDVLLGQHVSGLPIFSFSGISFSGDAPLVITAANGDKLYANYRGTFVPDLERKSASPSLVPYKIDNGGQYSITGGTGRFLGAQGRGSLTGIEDLDPTGRLPAENGKLQLNGTISY